MTTNTDNLEDINTYNQEVYSLAGNLNKDSSYKSVKDIQAWAYLVNVNIFSNPEKTIELYKQLIAEEFNEFMETENKSPEQFHELMDLLWVIYCYCFYCNYNIDKGLSKLFKANLTKVFDSQGHFDISFNPITGKLSKSTKYSAPDFSKLM